MESKPHQCKCKDELGERFTHPKHWEWEGETGRQAGWENRWAQL